MGKPHIEAYIKFQKKFYEITKKQGKEQYLVPYLMSSHPGSTLKDAVELAMFLKKNKIHPDQVQDFYPTPGTISTCMYYTGLDPYTLEPVYVAKTPDEKDLQRTLLQYYKPQNRRKVIMALQRAHRTDLIGKGSNCLVEPDFEYLRETQRKALNKKNATGNKKGSKVKWQGNQSRKHRR